MGKGFLWHFSSLPAQREAANLNSPPRAKPTLPQSPWYQKWHPLPWPGRAAEPDKRPKKFYPEKQLCPLAAGMSRDEIRMDGELPQTFASGESQQPRSRLWGLNRPDPPLRHLPDVCRGAMTNSRKKEQSGKIHPQQDGSLNPGHRTVLLRRDRGEA